ncbi:hypothetical protein J6590_071772 [Homalodisca vitripennis]|nr:hypothetical protein J6590_071772 [Homalodisca vitripennis]
MDLMEGHARCFGKPLSQRTKAETFYMSKTHQRPLKSSPTICSRTSELDIASLEAGTFYRRGQSQIVWS